MKYIIQKWKDFLSEIRNRGMQFMISASFTLVALVGMVFIGVFLFRSYGNASEEKLS